MDTNNLPKPWKYTDDILAVLIVGSYIAGKVYGFDIPEVVVGVVLGWAFGQMPKGSK